MSEPAEMFSDGVDGIRTTRMLERAVKNRWPIPDKYKEAIITRQVKIAISQESTARESASAARTILAADKLNIEQEKLEQPEQHLHLHQQIPHSKIFYNLPPVDKALESQPLVADEQQQS